MKFICPFTALLALIFSGCSTTKTVTAPPAPPSTAEISAISIMPPGFNGTNGGTNVLLSYAGIQYSLTNIIYPSRAQDGSYFYELTIAQGWGYVTNQPPYSVSCPSNLLIGYTGSYGDSGTNSGSITITNTPSSAYRFFVQANDDGTHGSNYPLTMVGFALPMMMTENNNGQSVRVSIYGLNKDYPTYEIQSSGDLLSWSNLASIPIGTATYFLDVTETNSPEFFRAANLTTNQ